jgi:SAM-dependent methyltransferase
MHIPLETKFISFAKKRLHLLDLSRFLSLVIREISYFVHRLQFRIEWIVDNPEHFDHYLDLHYRWKRDREAFPMERGVFSSFALAADLKFKGNTLDLCSGDGFYSYYFYSLRSERVTGIDFDPTAINWSRRNFSGVNIDFVLGDIRENIPKGPFENIVWDAAIEHFTPEEIQSIMKSIKSALTPSGILSGYTIVESADGGKHLHQHEYEFHDKQDLAKFLTPHFKNVQVISTLYRTRENLYFYASDSLLPFDRDNILTIKQ